MLAHIYLRVSTDEQDRSGLGLEDQEKLCRDRATRGEWLVGRVDHDALSGETPLAKRPGLCRLILGLRPGDVLIVSKRDRLSRGAPRITGEIEDAIRAKRARLISAAGEGTEADDSGSVFQRRIIDAVSENVKLTIRERTSGALARKADRGELVGRLGYGLALGDVIQLPSPNRRGKTTLQRVVPNPAEIRALDDLKRWKRDEPSLSLRQLAERLDESGAPTKSGRAWNRASVRKLLVRMNLPTDTRPQREQSSTETEDRALSG